MVAGAAGGAAIGSVVPGVGTAVGAVAGAASGLITHTAVNAVDGRGGKPLPGPLPGSIDVRTGKVVGGKKLPGHATGLDRVPYDNYVMRAHKDEAVLNKQDAREWRGTVKSGGKTAPRTVQIDKLVGQLIIKSDGTAKDLEAQADRFIAIVYEKLKDADEILSGGNKGALVL